MRLNSYNTLLTLCERNWNERRNMDGGTAATWFTFANDPEQYVLVWLTDDFYYLPEKTKRKIAELCCDK